MEVTGYAAEGKALAKIDGKVLFIENAVPGDIADVRITRSKKDWAEGRAVSISRYSDQRVAPFCMHFGVCGGCKWQMLPYEQQLQYKQKEATEAFRRIGKFTEIETLPILGSEKTRHYRNKLEFTASTKRFLTPEQLTDLSNNPWPGGALGYHAPRLFDKVIEISECHLMDEVNNTIRSAVRDYCSLHQCSYYDIREHKGWLRNIVIRKCTTGELMVNLVLGYEDTVHTPGILDDLLRKVPSITTLLYTINPKWNDSISDLEPKTYFGKGYVLELLGDYRFKISPKSFFQTNTLQARRLYEIVSLFAALTGKEIVYDLYCGTGSIGIYVSKLAAKVIGVEAVEDAVRDARENALLNQIDHARFFAGDVIDICNDEFFATHGRPDVVIVDPPRAGLHPKLIKKLVEISPGRLVYVSCNVATQARDLQLLDEAFLLEKLQPVDMFPHTHHLECVAALSLRNSPAC